MTAMNAMETTKPPPLAMGPLAWLRKNLFSTWYNIFLTLRSYLAAYTLLTTRLQWATTERVGV